MKNRWLIVIPIISALLILVVFVLVTPDIARGQATIPTRTPVPDSPTDPPPEPTKDDNNGGGDDNDDDDRPPPSDTPQATLTPVPSSTSIPPTVLSSPTGTITAVAPSKTPTSTVIAATASTTATAAATATEISGTMLDEIAPGTTPLAFPVAGSPFPTAEPCGEPPTITTLTVAKVYGGPGSDYPVTDTLRSKEVRPIVGRAAYATWWLIQLDENYSQAWISDRAGTVQGFTGNVPIVKAPSINGASPTPGDKWDPTPAPICTPTATPTSDGAVISGSLLDTDSSSAEKVNTTSDIDMAADERNQMAEAAEPLELDIPPAATPTPNLLPIAGLVLIIAAIFVALFLRRNPSGGSPST